MKPKKIAVIGCGIMGSGIAEVCAKSGYQTLIKENDDLALMSGQNRINENIDRQIVNEKLTKEEGLKIYNRFKWTTNLDDLNDYDFVIEAIIEDILEKGNLFSKLDDILTSEAVVASNTSSFSITELASFSKHPERIVGLHFFYPAPIMKLVEVVKTSMVAPQAVDITISLTKALKKHSILIHDRPGFVVNRLLLPYYLDAIRILEEGVASVEDIDIGMIEGGGFPIGPFRLLDHIGLDTIYSMANSFYNELHEKRFSPPPMLKRMVVAGLLGRKTGKGFYEYKG